MEYKVGDIVKKDLTSRQSWTVVDVSGKLKLKPNTNKYFPDTEVVDFNGDYIKIAVMGNPEESIRDYENLKYFTPSIEDIRVGYECEMYTHRFLEGYGWNKQILDSTLVAAIVTHSNELEKGIKTPYLTKEQIEAEGWKDKTSYLNINCWSFEKGNRFAVLKVHDLKNPFILQIIVKDPSIEELVFGVPSEHYRFIAPCKDINTFRYICKLLNI